MAAYSIYLYTVCTLGHVLRYALDKNCVFFIQVDDEEP